MSEKSSNIASQLRGIKKALIFMAGCLFVSAAANIYYVLDDIRENEEKRYGRTFYEKADTLAKEQEWDDLLKLAQDRKKERPRDINAFLFAGMAHFYRDELEQAESNFKHMVVINKAWKKTSDAWLKAIEDKRKETKQ